MNCFSATRLPIVQIIGALSLSFMFQGCFLGSSCGDGVIDNNEICDDGNGDGADFCDNSCKIGPMVALEGFVQKDVDSADILLVVDDSGSMAEEHINFMGQLQNIIADLGASGVPVRFAGVTSDADSNPQGNFITDSKDITLGNGSLVRDMPDEFCDAVFAVSPGGVIANNNEELAAVLASHPLIPDFTARVGAFVDANNDKISDTLIQPTFIDAVGCLLAVGIRGSGQEVAMCQAAAALDEASLARAGSAFLSTPDSVLGIIIIGDEDDCTLDAVETNGEFICNPLAIADSAILGLSCTQSATETNVCGTGESGQFESLLPVSVVTDRIKALRDEDHLYVATLTGPPAPSVADCEQNFPVPACDNENTGSASAGNRFFEFVSQFANRSDAFENSICGEPEEAISIVRRTLVKTVDFDCLETNIEAQFGAGFDIAKNMKVRLDLSQTGVSCESLSAIATTEAGACVLLPSAISLTTKASCGGGVELTTDDLGLPNRTRVAIEFRR